VGPTTDQRPPFCWSALLSSSSSSSSSYHHHYLKEVLLHQPDCFDFSWGIVMPPLETSSSGGGSSSSSTGSSSGSSSSGSGGSEVEMEVSAKGQAMTNGCFGE